MSEQKTTGNKKIKLNDLFAPRVMACLGSVIALQLVVFYLTRLPLAYMTLHRLAGPLDERIPLRPAWAAVYFLTFISWGVSLLWIMSESREHCYRFTAALMLAQLVSGAIFLLYPCTIDRPELVGGGLSMALMRFLYRVDSPTNLLPSFHVIFSYFCWRGTMGCTKIPRWYRCFNFLCLGLACAAILFVKQHVIADIPAAIVVSELALQTARLARLERIPFAVEQKIRKPKE